MHHFGNNFFLSLLIFSLILMITVHTISAANDTITTSQTIRDGETLVSSGGMFQLGFFSLANSSNRYVGICYNNINPKVYVWVANRESPLTTKSGVLTVMEPGILILVNNETNATIWSSTASRTVQNPTVRLLDSGNLVVINDDTPEDILWQSFDNPTDTYLPGMTSLGWNLKTGYPQIVVRRGKTVKFRLGPWNGVRFSGAPGTRNNPTLRMNKDEVKYGEDNVDKSIITRLTLSLEGVGVRWLWNGSSKSWMSYNMEADACDTYGAYGSCGVGDSPICSCMDRFVPRVGERWGRGEWSEGCVARSALNCEDDVFLKYTAIKLPDARNSSYDDRKMMPAECETECLKNCSCTAYKQLDIREETGGCLFYFGDLVDVRSMVAGGDELYIRIASADLENDADSKRRKRVILIASLTPVLVILVLFVMVIWICIWKRKKHSYARAQGGFSGSLGNESELPFFTLSSISKATNSFSMDNKLGEGGFGPVFKGVLENGQEIAVKRLSKTSKQGVDELKNELILIAKLQHRNLWIYVSGICNRRDVLD